MDIWPASGQARGKRRDRHEEHQHGEHDASGLRENLPQVRHIAVPALPGLSCRASISAILQPADLRLPTLS